MLINLSNHPSDKWGEKQQEAAKKFGEIVDIQFPNIPADADDHDLNALVREYHKKVTDLGDGTPMKVHVMGEMTFTHRLINLLAEFGNIPCIASCTARNVVELPDGTKQSRFEFVQFRRY
ncbi:MAG: CRISPR-associated protein [Muribaculaceae bacterium]|nr:CRISPR-associated protein [Muribaculaceae bacterium]